VGPDRLLQSRERIASRADHNRCGLAGRHLKVQDAVFGRAEIAQSGLVKHSRRSAYGVAQVKRTTRALGRSQPIELSAYPTTGSDYANFGS
jgi:hypothetical protein